jgi:chromosome segregation ATPase
MPRPRKIIPKLISPPIHIELSESVLEAALVQALQPLSQQVSILTVEHQVLQQQLAACLTAQASLVETLPPQLNRITNYNRQIYRILHQLLKQFENESTQSQLVKQLEQLMKSLNGLTRRLEDSINSQKKVSDSLESLNKRFDTSPPSHDEIPF